MASPEKLFAYAGKILRVNLTSGEIKREPLLALATAVYQQISP